MRKKTIVSVLLSALILVMPLSSCDKKNDGTKTPSAKNPITETISEVEGRLHEVNVTETQKPFVSEGKTEYALVVPDSDKGRKAGQFVASHLLKATGAELPVKTSAQVSSVTDSSKYIVFDETLYVSSGLRVPQEDLGITGYCIRSKGNSVFVYTESEFGYQQAAICLLRHLVGYEMYSSNVVCYHKAAETVTLPEFDITEKPDIEIRASGNNLTDDATLYGMGFNNRGNFVMTMSGIPYHNFSATLKLAGADTTATYHPWLSDDCSTFSVGTRQPCFTAHGDEAELEKMITALSEVIVAEAEKESNLSLSMFTLGIEDGWGQCTCSACAAEEEKYGTQAGASVKFFNRLSRKIQAHFEEKANETGTKKREFHLIMFAYKYTETPPVKYENGAYVPIDDEVVLDDDVGVFFAPIKADYHKSFYSETNEPYKANLEGWGAICKRLYMWLYQTNFSNYLYANGICRSFSDNYKLCVKNNAVYMYNQGNYQNKSTHFTALKEYLDSKLSFDVCADAETLTDKFFENYFGAAAEPMRKMYDAIDLYYDYLYETYPETISGGIYNAVNQAKYWPWGTLQSYTGFVEDAYSRIEPLAATDSALYATLYENVLRESIFPRFALLDLHQGKYSASEFKELASAFKADCGTLKITLFGEGTNNLSKYYSKWGV